MRTNHEGENEKKARGRNVLEGENEHKARVPRCAADQDSQDTGGPGVRQRECRRLPCRGARATFPWKVARDSRRLPTR